MEEQNAVIGRMFTELKSKRQRLQALLTWASDLGQELERIGKVLQDSPQYAGLNGESAMAVDRVPPGAERLFERKLFDADKFRDTTNEIRETMSAIADLEKRLG